MTVKYSKIFTVIGAITIEPVTILVEYIEAEGFRGVSIESLEGEYASAKEFGKASKHVIEDMKENDDKIYTFLPLMPFDTRQLVEALIEALSEDARACFTERAPNTRESRP
jgi:hypothetical protein